jgi:hypothetical protein
MINDLASTKSSKDAHESGNEDRARSKEALFSLTLDSSGTKDVTNTSRSCLLPLATLITQTTLSVRTRTKIINIITTIIISFVILNTL